MAITFFGAASTPTDGASATNTSDPTVVTPPSNMLAGDLVFMYGCKRVASGNIAISEAGGQFWQLGGIINSSQGTISGAFFWCTFDGIWTANPSISFTSTTNNIVVMIVFRSTLVPTDWKLENISVNINPGITSAPAAASMSILSSGNVPSHSSNVTIGIWNTDDDNTWGTLTGTGWDKTGLSAQYRNTSGQDASASFAYLISPTPPFAPVTQTELTLGNDGGITGWISLTEGFNKTINDYQFIKVGDGMSTSEKIK